MNPLSPEVHRRRAWWYYSQCAFGVYDGDLQFYSDEWDGPAVAGEIDTAECPVFLLTGEYDYSSPPEATRRLAVRIPGADFRVMKDLGHFPMTENPDLFRIHLLPVLQKLKSLMLRRSSPS
jgi:pimeloyl-ACP methyl ester carboxylesterase